MSLKKKFSLIFTILLSGLFFACDSEDVENNYENEAKPTFIGMIEEINGDSAIVYVEEGDISDGSIVFVNLSVNITETFQVGDQIKVKFDGPVLESHPAQINTLLVELIE